MFGPLTYTHYDAHVHAWWYLAERTLSGLHVRIPSHMRATGLVADVTRRRRAAFAHPPQYLGRVTK